MAMLETREDTKEEVVVETASERALPHNTSFGLAVQLTDMVGDCAPVSYRKQQFLPLAFLVSSIVGRQVSSGIFMSTVDPPIY